MTLTYNNFENYMMHYKGNADRKKFMLNQFKKENMESTWIEDFDREELTYDMVIKNFDMTAKEFHRRSYKRYNFLMYPLTPSEISLCLKQKEAMRLFLENSKKDYMFIMEDDVILIPSFVEELNKYLKTIPEDWDVAYIGHSGGARVDPKDLIDGQHWYKRDFPQGKGTDSMLFKRTTIESIYKHMCRWKISFPIDHELTYILDSLMFSVYWLDPPIVAQGSQTGYFNTFQPEGCHYVDTSVQLRNDMKELING